ncbi:MAG: hypothetical protein FWH20_10825 [Oscillospiraceae bacterium]|nr:hypothetical protein [Oscillospiraceae bacterium]
MCCLCNKCNRCQKCNKCNKCNNHCKCKCKPDCNCPECPPFEPPCRCSERGELIMDGGFESWIDRSTPTYWNHTGNGLTSGAFETTDADNVLSGGASVGIKNASIYQTVDIRGDCLFEFSFSARSNTPIAKLVAIVSYIHADGTEWQANYVFIEAGSLPISPRVFNFYKRTLHRSPPDAVQAKIEFRAETSPPSLGLYIFVDDVSFRGIC